jgi:type II secretory pathway component GspD/PulD (secretin)
MQPVLVRRALTFVAAALALTLLVSTARADGPAAAVRKALDQKITLDFQTQDFNEAVEHLRQKTKINFQVDNLSMQLLGLAPGVPMPVHLKSDNGKLRIALQNMLSPLNATYVILGDTVVITPAEVALERQMNQRVSVEAKDTPLADVLKQLADDTGANVVIDPRQAKKAATKVTLQLDDVMLEAAVRLLTEIADLNCARVGNVLFVTSDERADKLRKELPPSSNPLNPLLPPRFGIAGGFGGIMPGGFGGGFGGFGGGARTGPPVVIPPPPPGREPPVPVPDPKKEEKR